MYVCIFKYMSICRHTQILYKEIRKMLFRAQKKKKKYVNEMYITVLDSTSWVP